MRFYTGTDDFHGTGMANSTIPGEFRNVTRTSTVLKAHGMVGANTVILPGITIGAGTAIGAGSLVREDLAPWMIYAGNPIEALRERRSDNILRLEQILYEKYGRPRKLYRNVLQK